MADDRLPAFMIIGAVKAATTWIAHQLRSHPALWLPNDEPHYFSGNYARGIGWYRSRFAAAPASLSIGEKSADYFAHPDAARRIASLLPRVPLVLQLRDPVKRAYSDYCMLYRRGQVAGDPQRYLTRASQSGSRFLNSGLYASHLERFLTFFPRDQICVFLYEDVCDRPETVIRQVCAHIGVEPHIAEEEIATRRNDSRAELLPLSLRKLLRPARPLLDPLRSVPWLASLRSSMARPVRYPPVTPELRATLRRFYRDDIHRLEGLIDRDLGAWLSDAGQPETIGA